MSVATQLADVVETCGAEMPVKNNLVSWIWGVGEVACRRIRESAAQRHKSNNVDSLGNASSGGRPQDVAGRTAGRRLATSQLSHPIRRMGL